jgi:hypothetical protein
VRGWTRTGRPRGAHDRDKRTEREHPVGLDADGTRQSRRSQVMRHDNRRERFYVLKAEG